MKKVLTSYFTLLAFISLGQVPFQFTPQSPKQFQESISNTKLENVSAQGESLEAALNEAFDNIVQESEITGFTAAMMLPDGTIWERASGLATEGTITTDLTSEHLMGMGSITKSFIAATLVLMAEDQMLSLDDSIGTYLPSFPNISGAATIRQLLSHRTGFSDYLNENVNSTNAWISDLDSIWSIENILNSFVLEPNFEIDEDWSYSNTNFLLAGLIIESVEEKPWFEVVRNRILDPLNLTSTFAHPFEDYGSQPYAHAFTDLVGDGIFQDMQQSGFPLTGLFSMAASAGNLITTAEDLVKFTNALHNEDLVLPSSLDEMYFNNSLGEGLDYGLGVFRAALGSGNFGWGHNGSIVYNSMALYIPNENISIAVQQNDVRISGALGEFIDITDVFLGLLDAYSDYDPVSNTIDTSDEVLKIYPNPSDGEFVIELLEDSYVDFTDITGRIVYNMKLFSGQNQVNLDALATGVYFVQIGEVVKKIMVE